MSRPQIPRKAGQTLIVVGLSTLGIALAGGLEAQTRDDSADEVPPEIAVTAPAEAFTNDPSPQIVITYSDDDSGVDPATLEVLLDEIDLTPLCIVSASGATCASPELAQGDHTVTASVRDQAGNIGLATRTFAVDVTVPGLAVTVPDALPGASIFADGFESGDLSAWIAGPPSDLLTNDATPEVVVTYSDALSGIDSATLSIEVDGISLLADCAVGPEVATCRTPELAEGMHTAVATVSDLAGNSTSDTVTLTVDLTPPAITAMVDPPAGASGWHQAPVTVSFECSDALSGVASCPEPVILSSEGAGQEVAGTAFDLAGNSASATAIVNIDLTPPVITAMVDPPAGAGGWHQAPVTIRFECSDALSGVASCPAPMILSAEGAGQEAAGTAFDLAGNSASATAIVNVDLTPPVITATVDPPAGASGWHGAPVTVRFECSDALSGVASCPAAVTVSAEGAGQEVAGTAFDLAGNSASATAIVNVDLTPPVITATVDPPVGASGWHGAPVTVSFVCSDALSGVASCPEPTTLSAEGADQEVTGTATDLAGHSASTTATVSIDLTPPTFDPAEFEPSACPGLTVDSLATVRACFADALAGVDEATVQLLIDGVDQSAAAVLADGCISWDPPQVFAPGEHQAEIAASDLAGNSDAASWCFAIAASDLEIAITSPVDGLLTTAATIDVTGTVDPLAEAVQINGAAATLGVGTFEALGVALAEGDNVLKAVAFDAFERSGSDSVTVTRDSTPPAITATIEPAAGGTGWHQVAATVSFVCSDTGSGVATCSGPTTVSAEGGGQEVTGTATDLAGLSATTTGTVNLDLTPPTISALVAPPANAAGWHNSAVTVSFDCADALSGLASCSAPRTSITEGAAQQVAGLAIDLAGHSVGANVEVSIDLSPPVFDPALLQPPPCPQATELSRPQVRACFADAVSGIDEASVTLSVDEVDRTAQAVIAGGCVSWDPPADLGPGQHQAVITADDVADNHGTVSWCFEVAPPPLAITIDSPLAGLLISGDTVDVTGTVEAAADNVTVDGVAVPVVGTTFSRLAVPLSEGRNVITAIASDAAGRTGTASVVVLRDTSAPRVMIETPRAGAVLTSLQVDVAGLVNDLIAGTTINADDCDVTVNGVEAAVANRSFLVPDLLLKRGSNTLTAIATDRLGNSASTSIEVTVEDRAGQRIVLLAGNGQSAGIFEQLSDRLVVALLDAAGDPVVGRPVTFEVSRGAGTLSAFPEEGREITVLSDDFGHAGVGYRLGGRAGTGNHRVLATAPGFLGEVEFCAAATPAPAQRVVATAGGRQVGAVGEPLPQPLVVVVTDVAGNPVPAVDITFAVTRGGGGFGVGRHQHRSGSPSIVVSTDFDGLAEAVWTLGPEPGIDNHGAQASFVGLSEAAAAFTATARRAGMPSATSLSGVVLDNQDRPLPAATVTVEGTVLMALTDAEGRFSIAGAPVGTIHLNIDGSTTSRAGEWPNLSFELVTIAGTDNSVDRPIYMLPLDLSDTVPASSSEDRTLSLAGVPGSELTVYGNSVTCPDGSTDCAVSVTQVRGERIPMEPPQGSTFMLAWTIQPAGASFDPPARLCIPNADLAPGQQAEMFSFDHDQGAFIAIGTATVVADGSQLCSDPGFGVVHGGWHGCAPPTPPCSGSCNDCPPPPSTCQTVRREGGGCDGCTCVIENKPDGSSCDSDDACSSGICESGDCEASDTPMLTDVSTDPELILGEDLSVSYTVVADSGGGGFDSVELRISNNAGTMVFIGSDDGSPGMHEATWAGGKWNQAPHAEAFANPNNGSYTVEVVGIKGSSDCASEELSVDTRLVLEADIRDNVPAGATMTEPAGVDDMLDALTVVLKLGDSETIFADSIVVTVTSRFDQHVKIESAILNSLQDGDYEVLFRDLRDEIGNFSDHDDDPDNGFQPIQFDLPLW